MKLGFLFLCKNDINQLQLWLDFFKNNYDKCNIYIHSYDQQNITQDFIKKYHIDKVLDTGWGDIYDVVRYVMDISIKNNDYKLILLSESNIPTKSFNYIYNYLTTDDKGYLNYDTTSEYLKNMKIIPQHPVITCVLCIQPPGCCRLHQSPKKRFT